MLFIERIRRLSIDLRVVVGRQSIEVLEHHAVQARANLDDQTAAGAVGRCTDLGDDELAAVLALDVLLKHSVLDDEFADRGREPTDVESAVAYLDGADGQVAGDLDHGGPRE